MDARQAAQFGDENRIRHLLDTNECTPDSLDADDCSLLHWAAINNRLSVARLLIERGCRVNAVGGVLASTPLHWAARHGHPQMVALLVMNGADLRLHDVEGFTALHIAVQFGRTATAAYLIAAGQSPDEKDETMMTPLMWAAYKVFSRDPLQMLLTMGADTSCKDKTFANTALHWAAVQSNHCAINVLVKHNADLTARNRDNETPRDIAIRRCDFVSVRILERAERRKGLIPSSIKQSIKDNNSVLNKSVYIAPLIIMVMIGLILHSSYSYSIKFAFFLITISIVWLFHRYLMKGETFFQLPLGLAIASKLLMILTWFLLLHSSVGWHMQIAFFILSTSVPVIFMRLIFSDPGIVTASYEEKCKMIRGMWEVQRAEGSFCVTCLVKKPQGSKHCFFCGFCIKGFDHHCPWVANCIGENNHFLFILYVLTVVLSSSLFIFGCFNHWKFLCGGVTVESVVYCNPWITYTFLMSLYHFVWTTAMFIFQLYQIVYDRSSGEFYKLHREYHKDDADQRPTAEILTLVLNLS